MKTRNYFLALTVLLAAACSVEQKEELADIIVEDAPVITASIEDLSTKVTMNEKLQLSWAAGDALYVQGTGSNSYEYTTQQTGKTATFNYSGWRTPQLKDGGNVVYPYSSYKNGQIIFPATYTISTADENAGKLSSTATTCPMPLVGKLSGTNGVNCTLHYVSAAIRVTYQNVSYNTSKLVITTTGNTITGNAALNGTDAVSITSGGNSVTVNLPKKYREEMTVIVPVPVGTYNKIKVELQDDNGNPIEATTKQSTKKTYTLKTGDILNFPVIKPNYPNFVMGQVYPEDLGNLDEGDYVLTFDRGIVATEGDYAGEGNLCWVNGDDNAREAVEGVILSHDYITTDGVTIGAPCVVLNYADFVTCGWHLTPGTTISTYSGYSNVYTATTNDKGSLVIRLTYTENDNEFITVQVLKGFGNNDYYDINTGCIRYLTKAELGNGYSDPIWNNGGFIFPKSQGSNIHIYVKKAMEQPKHGQ